jgi:hypothetical protein
MPLSLDELRAALLDSVSRRDVHALLPLVLSTALPSLTALLNLIGVLVEPPLSDRGLQASFAQLFSDIAAHDDEESLVNVAYKGWCVFCCVVR